MRRAFHYDSLMFVPFRHLIGWVLSGFRSREDLILDNLALRQQLLAFHLRRPRPRLGTLEKLFWVAMRNMWPGWRKSLILVTPETVIRWHRAGFRLYWACLSRTQGVGGRKPLTKELRDLIFRMVAENPTWEHHAFTGSCSNWVSTSQGTLPLSWPPQCLRAGAPESTNARTPRNSPAY